MKILLLSSIETVNTTYFIHRFSNVWSKKRIQVFACRSLHVLIKDGRHLGEQLCDPQLFFRGREGEGNCATS